MTSVSNVLALSQTSSSHLDTEEDIPPWHREQLKLLGTYELLPNGKVNPLITEMFTHTTYHTLLNEPWCAADQCYCLWKAGYKNPKTAAAHGFVHYGVPSKIRKGAIIVIQHANGHFHVTQFSHWIDEKNQIACCVGGNQNNRVKYSTYDFKVDKPIAVRWPDEKAV